MCPVFFCSDLSLVPVYPKIITTQGLFLLRFKNVLAHSNFGVFYFDLVDFGKTQITDEILSLIWQEQLSIKIISGMLRQTSVCSSSKF